MNLPVLIYILTGAVIAKGIYDDKNKVRARRSTPEEKIANLNSRMQSAFASGDLEEYRRLQTEIELIRLGEEL